MQDCEGILERINKSKRRLLMKFLNEHDGEEARLLPAGGTIPESPRKDYGPICLILVARNIYLSDYTDYFTILDTLDPDGSEKFQRFYKQAPEVQRYLFPSSEPMEPQPPTVPKKKGGRPRRIFTDEEKKRIRDLHLQGLGIKFLAEIFVTSNRKIMEVLKNEP